ncbi:hypothetical protein [Pseudoduganella sp. RAF53_2]|uniref:hypothetical protein n=1 Tax=unclassified Pseudoduganella TaxID=2637179 RepID=UPI003F95E2EF
MEVETKSLSVRLPDSVDEDDNPRRGDRLNVYVNARYEAEPEKPELPSVTLGKLRKLRKRARAKPA